LTVSGQFFRQFADAWLQGTPAAANLDNIDSVAVTMQDSNFSRMHAIASTFLGHVRIFMADN
jgi:hypothetical protein